MEKKKNFVESTAEHSQQNEQKIRLWAMGEHRYLVIAPFIQLV